ncbi:MAG: hypothetical protein AAAB36_15355, partial [Ensifer adhaerens]
PFTRASDIGRRPNGVVTDNLSISALPSFRQRNASHRNGAKSPKRVLTVNPGSANLEIAK